MTSIWRALEKNGFLERLTMTSSLLFSRLQRTALALPVHGKGRYDGNTFRRKVQCWTEALSRRAVQCSVRNDQEVPAVRRYARQRQKAEKDVRKVGTRQCRHRQSQVGRQLVPRLFVD